MIGNEIMIITQIPQMLDIVCSAIKKRKLSLKLDVLIYCEPESHKWT